MEGKKGHMKSKRVFVVLAMLILAAMAGCGAPEKSADMELSPTLAPLTVSERRLVYSNAHIDVDIAYPEIAGMEDALAQGNVNSQVGAHFKSKADEIEAQSEEDDAYGPHSAYFIETRFETRRNDGFILSILLSTTYYEGGANTGSDVGFINIINTDPAQQPVLKELFAEGADYASVLDGKIRAIIAAGPDPDGIDYTSVTNAYGYYLTDTDLVVVFERYTIAAGAYGEPEFEIPLDDLADILIPGMA
jgi:hypothetical protein